MSIVTRSPFELDAAGGEQLQYVRIRFLFYFEHSLAECVGGVVVEHGDRLLPDDGAVVVFVVDKVDRAAGDFHARVEDRLVNVIAVHAVAAKAGNQRRVNVDDSAGKILGQRRELHEAGHRHVVDTGVAARREYGVAERFVACRSALRGNRSRRMTCVGMPASSANFNPPAVGELETTNLMSIGRLILRPQRSMKFFSVRPEPEINTASLSF